ncbi:MAG: CHAT domain-containing protein [Chloroflexi bacterium]|nr:CHAT domain-containing protein [Chloroflexota bacterium]
MKQRQYVDFKLYLTRPADGQAACQVALLPTPEAGETITPVTVPASEAPASDMLAYLAGKQITLRNLVSLGKKLAGCLLPEGVIRERFRYAYDQAGVEGGVRLRLIIADHALKQWPWEYAFLDLLGGPDSMRGFLALNPRISVVRHEPLPHPHPAIAKSSADVTDIRLAIATALPAQQSVLYLDKDVAAIQRAVQDFDLEGVRITVDPVLMDATPGDLATKLPKGTYIFHFAGHGITEQRGDPFTPGSPLREEGALLLVADKIQKNEVRLRAGDLAAILQERGVRLAVLGACYSGARNARYPWDGVAGALAAGEIPAIIAMQYEVIDVAAQAFSGMFYSALAGGLSLDEAMYVGRRAMLLETSTDKGLDQPFNAEWGVPVLYSRLPDGALFPERMARAGAAAEQFRKVIQQTVETIAQGGTVVGLVARRVKGGIKIEQRVKVVAGTLVGLQAEEVGDEANLDVAQNLGTVSGNVTGVIVDEI